MPVTEFLETRLWQPMGAEAAGSWSLDSEESGFEKMESGINGRAIDFLKLGRLFLNKGRNGDRQVVTAAWVAEATRRDTTTDPAAHYQYFWWVDEEHDAYYAEGNHGQFIVVVPKQELVILRMGDRYGYDDWGSIFGQIADDLTG
ncbi:MAG: serine hydrolase [Acidimicrobiia bacterium]|nr:serine hydrolase [Acidimicrobiia bacterium]